MYRAIIETEIVNMARKGTIHLSENEGGDAVEMTGKYRSNMGANSEPGKYGHAIKNRTWLGDSFWTLANLKQAGRMVVNYDIGSFKSEPSCSVIR